MSEVKPKQEEYPEIQVPVAQPTEKPVEEPGIHPGKMRRFMRQLSRASTKVETQIRAKADVRGKIEKIKSMSLNKRTKKAELESELTDFETMIHNIVMDEQKILDEQRRETREMQSLKKIVEDLSTKLVQLGREYAIEMEKKDKKIFDLRDNLATARMKASEAKDDRQEKIAAIEQRIKTKTKAKRSEISSVANDLKALEDTHRKLTSSKKHPKQDLDRLKKVIDSHKNKLKALKR